MRLRAGNYTIYNGFELKIFEGRYEMSISDDEKMYSLCYEADSGIALDGFQKHDFENMLCKGFYLKELKNAFFIQTYGLYKGLKVKVFEFRPNPNIVFITSDDKIAFENFSFLDMVGTTEGT